MVAIFTGAGFGFGRGSGSVLGDVGLLGGAVQGRSGDAISVNAATGNLLIQKQDEFLIGRGPDASVARTYNSLTSLGDDNNDKWRQSTDRRVYGLTGTLNAAGSTVKRVSGDGTEVVYSWDATRSAYVTKDGGGAYDTIVKSGAEWVWTEGDTRTVERYFDDAAGKIKSVADNVGTVMSFTYDGSGRLSLVTTNDGSWIRYDWSGSTNNISQIVTGYTDLATSTSKTLARTRYGYDGSNRLTTVTVDLTPDDNAIADGQTYVTTYGYDASNRVNSITQSDGSALTITYDGSGRVSTLVQTVASGVTRTTTLNYYAGYSTVTNPTGQVTRLDYDANGNLTKITAPPAYSGATAQVWQFAYNANGDVTSTTDPQSQVTSFSNFTANGMAQTITDRAGNATTRTFDATNHVLSETYNGIDATGASVAQTVRYVYNSAGNLRFAISAEGRVTEYVRNSYGAITSEIQYVEAAYTTAGTPAESTMTTWTAGLADKSWVQRVDYQYDTRLGLVKGTSYGIASTAGAGQTTQGIGEVNYVYDQAGQLLSSYATGQGQTTYVYDGLGRLKASTDAAGNTTSIVFNDANTTTTITNSGGRTIVETYNKAGDLIQHSESGTNATATTVSYAVDKLGRARVTTFAGSTDKIYDHYDAAGRHVATVDGVGRITEYRYDANNRLVGTISYRNTVSSSYFATLDNPDNTLALATIRPATHAEDVSSWTIYDAEGRVLQTIAGNGSTVISTYDAAGRLQKSTSYVNKVAAATVAGFITAAPTAVITPTTNAGDLTKRYFYDKDGRLLGTIDGEKYVVRNTYDQAGQLVATTAYANATTAASPTTASFNTIIAGVTTSAQDRTSRYVYDGRGELRYTVDALGKAVRYDYDAAGLKTRTVAYATALGTLSDYTFDYILAQLATQESGTAKRVSYAVYDNAGRLAYSLDQVGTASTSTDMAVTAYVYDAVGNVIRTIAYATARATASLPTKTAMDSWAASAGNAADRVTRMWYTGRNQLAYGVDAEGYVSKLTYDSKGRVTAETVWENAITVSDSTTYAQVAAAATGTSYSNSRTYDALDRVVRQYDFSGSNYTEYSYLGATNLVSTVIRAAGGTAQEQSTLTNVYDGAGRVITATDATGTTEAAASSYNYDGRGLMTSMVDPRSKTTSYTYDLDGRVKTMTDAASGVTTYDYNAFGEVWKVTDARGNASYSWYDKAGRVTTTRDAENYLTTTSYTVFGEIASVKRWATPATGTPVIGTEPVGSGTVATTQFTYDKAGRVLTSVNALNHTESYSYNSFGDRISVTNRASTVTSYTIDRLGRVTRESVNAATANINAAGTVTTGAQNVKTYAYDSRGNVKTLVEGFSTTAGGAVTELRTTTYSYNDASQLTQTTYNAVTVIADDMVTTSSATPTEQFTYDKRGNVIKSVDKAGAQVFSYYDDLDRKIAEIRQLSTTQTVYTSYAYDGNGNLVTTKVYEGNAALPGSPGGTPPAAPSGLYRQTDFIYDNLNRMTASTVVSNTGNVITSGSWNGTSYAQATGNLVTQYQYDANGNVVKVTDPNGSVTWNWFDKLGRKINQLDGEGYLTNWTYDAEGHVLSEVRYATKFTGTPSLTTPPTVGTTGNDRTTIYTYDLNGNRLTEKRTGVAAWTVSASTGALSAAGTDAIISYTYNALGQVTTKTVANALIATYVYDNTGRLTSEQKAAYTDANGASVTPTTNYEYDALGDLTRTTQLGATGTYAAADRVTTYRYAEGGRLVAMVDAEGFAHNYYYDVAGRLKKDAYSRVVNTNNTISSNATTTVAEAQTSTYDLAGRVLSQAIYSTVGGTFKRIGLTSFQYNNFGQVTQQGTGTNSATDIAAGTALYQVTNQYDAAGRLTGTNGGDGVWKFFGYDKAGNQTVAVTSAGATFTSGTGLATALSQVGNGNVNGTYTVYDARNQATQVVEEGRDLSATVTNQTLATSRSYNAFGEVATETDARGYTITYTYNTMGRMIRSESPGVQITNENGGTNWVRPSEDYYYDLGGRLIAMRDANGTYGAGTSGAPASKAANTGNLTTYALLAGTGYDGSESVIAIEFHADGGRKETLFDRMGDARVLRDELYSAGTPNLRVTEQTFNKLGQLTQVKHNRLTSVADDSTRLVDNYAYDQFGQRIQHWNSQYGMTVIEKSGYDGLGRITAQVDMSGYVTSTAYGWDGTLVTSGLGTFGGWVETTTYANSRTAISKADIFDHEVFRQDLGAHQSAATFDAGGRQLTSGNLSYSWYNTGLLATSAAVTGTMGTGNWSRKLTTYGYDKTGNRTSEKLITDGSSYSVAFNYQYIDETAAYDALGRLTSMSEAGSSYTPAATITNTYDAAGNVRSTVSTHAVLNLNGEVASTTTDTYWYRYDSMNRLVTDRGMLSGTAGAAGTTIARVHYHSYPNTTLSSDYVYDLTGQRVAAIRTDYLPGSYSYYYGTYIPGYYQESREMYDYDGAGRITAIRRTQGTAASENYDYVTGISTPPSSIPAAPTTGGGTPSTFGYDSMGRQTSQSDYQSGAVYSRTTTYAANGAQLSDDASTLRGDGNLYRANSSFTFTASGTGEYLLGAVGTVTTANYKNGSYQNSSSTVNTYQWWDSAAQGTIAYKPNTSNSTTYTTTFYYDGEGVLTSADIVDGRPRSVTFRTNGEGQVIRRDEADNHDNPTTGGDPHEIWYRFGGRELGYVGNNGTSRMSTVDSIADRRVVPGTGAFRNGSIDMSPYSDFAQSSNPVNSYAQGSAAGGYTVQRAGETLRSVAQQLWGDSSLWYKLAEANGIQGDMALAQGQRLNVPAGITRTHHNAATFRPYDANEATGNVSPTTPKPAKKNKCGVFGQILLAAIAIAVTVIALPAGGLAAGWSGIGQGALAGLAGSAASQAVGVATGIQSKFDFKGLALAGIAGGVTAGLGPSSGVFKGGNGLFGQTVADAAGKAVFQAGASGIQSATLSAVAQGALSNALTQGIGVATGLQGKFSWTGVATAGIGAGVGGAIAGELKIKDFSADGGRSLGNIAGHTLAGSAGAMAAAATRSALSGGSFGDNLMRELPSAIGNTIGNLVAEGVRRSESRALFNDAIEDPSVQSALQTQEAQAALIKIGYKPGDRVTPEQLTQLLTQGTAGLSADGVTGKIKGNILDFVNRAGEAASYRWNSDAASVALAKNSALIATYSAIGLTMPGFQWTMVGAFVAYQVREQIITIADAGRSGKLGALLGPLGVIGGMASRALGDHMINTIIDGQVKVVSDIGSLALGYRQLGAGILASRTVSSDGYATSAIHHQIAADNALKDGNMATWAWEGFQAAVQLGYREQRGLQAMWNDPILNKAAGVMSSLGLLNTTINTPIGRISAPKSVNDVRRLDQRMSLAVNAFNYMYRNLYSGPNMARNWSAVTNVLTQRLDPAALPQPAVPNI
jgi:YD repeat-containing protein